MLPSTEQMLSKFEIFGHTIDHGKKFPKSSQTSISRLLVPRIKNHLSSFELGFLNIFSRQNLLRSLLLVLFLLQRYKYGAKKCPKNHVRFDVSQSENRKTIEKPLKELSWNQQTVVHSCLQNRVKGIIFTKKLFCV